MMNCNYRTKGENMNQKQGKIGRGLLVLGIPVFALFLAGLPAYAQDNAAALPGITDPVEDQQPKDIFSLAIPASWGRIKEVYKGKQGKTIVHIQDAHCNYDCQAAIGKVLDELVNE